MTLILNAILAALIISSANNSISKEQVSISRYGEILLNDISEKERRDVYFILNNCPGVRSDQIDPFDVLVLLRLEKDYSIPLELKGLLPAIFCIESNLQKGYGLYGDGGLALGPGQLHKAPYMSCLSTKRDKYSEYDFRNDFVFSARCWVTNIKRVNMKVEKLCPNVSNSKKWIVSEAFVSAYSRYKDKGCQAKSKHVFLLETWKNKGFSK